MGWVCLDQNCVEQEYIPAGCVPSATVTPYHACSPTTHASLAMHAPCHACPLPCTPPPTMHAPHHAHRPPCTPPLTEFLTHTCENITTVADGKNENVLKLTSNIIPFIIAVPRHLQLRVMKEGHHDEPRSKHENWNLAFQMCFKTGHLTDFVPQMALDFKWRLIAPPIWKPKNLYLYIDG